MNYSLGERLKGWALASVISVVIYASLMALVFAVFNDLHLYPWRFVLGVWGGATILEFVIMVVMK